MISAGFLSRLSRLRCLSCFFTETPTRGIVAEMPKTNPLLSKEGWLREAQTEWSVQNPA
jgi:hypothetical protein